MESNGKSIIKIIEMDTQKIEEIILPENIKNFAQINPGIWYIKGINGNYKINCFRFHVDTPLTYNEIYEYDFNTR